MTRDKCRAGGDTSLLHNFLNALKSDINNSLFVNAVVETCRGEFLKMRFLFLFPPLLFTANKVFEFNSPIDFCYSNATLMFVYVQTTI